ncbi:MAG: serine/threonine protein kinase [Gemmataceae bacterium]|nr:serine/threonine protein kinase [Gemmataceae bacterium]MDW8264758.1 serine/threonine-protein kinase [Gemmataceae bacterium]
MSVTSANVLIEWLRQYRLLEPAQLAELTHKRHQFPVQPQALVKELVRRGWLTVFQANYLLESRARELVFGPYRILDHIGRGGLCDVYKACHVQKQCLVALKVVRPDYASHPDALAQFQKEMQAIVQLSHPNVVRAVDTEVVAGGRNYFAMEYVEGVDLNKLVQTFGPLPIMHACEYARQAALGLQHIYEHGLVHRDIKPANLLRVGPTEPTPVADANAPPTALIKILDLGLALLEWIQETDERRATLHRMSHAVLGSPDFISPEQALNPDQADIRSDIYSLGCTLYFLLTGQVPFPGTSLAQKLVQHQNEEPVPVEQRRPEVVPGLAATVRKMMAKRPADRYQTPAAVATALAPFSRRSSGFIPRPIIPRGS